MHYVEVRPNMPKHEYYATQTQIFAKIYLQKHAIVFLFSKLNTCKKLGIGMQQIRLCQRHQKYAKFGKKKVTVGKSAQTFA